MPELIDEPDRSRRLVNQSRETKNGILGITDFIGMATVILETGLRQDDARDAVVKLIKIQESDKIMAMLTMHSYCLLANLGDFEVVHGVSRIVRLVPDKLNLAIVINGENLPDPKDDGTFFVVLVIDLLEKYQGMVKQGSALRVQVEEGQKSFFDCMQSLRDKLESFNENLSHRGQEQYKESVEEILELAGDIQVLCEIYLCFVHPALILRDPEANVQQLKDKTVDKLAKVGSQVLLEEYKKLKQENQERDSGFVIAP